MKKKPKVGDKVSYQITNGIGTGIILDPEFNGIPKNVRLYFEREKYVLIQALVNNNPSFCFWKRYKDINSLEAENKG